MIGFGKNGIAFLKISFPSLGNNSPNASSAQIFKADVETDKVHPSNKKNSKWEFRKSIGSMKRGKIQILRIHPKRKAGFIEFIKVCFQSEFNKIEGCF